MIRNISYLFRRIRRKWKKVLSILRDRCGKSLFSLKASIVLKLQTNTGTTVENKIEVDVKANNRWSSRND